MLFRFPAGFDRHPEQAPGSIDEVQVLDGAAELQEIPPSKQVARGCSLVVRGWTFDPLAMAPAAQVVLTMDDRFPVEATYGSRRDDIAVHFQQEGLVTTGFRAIVSTGGAALAPHVIRLYALASGGSRYFATSSSFSFDVVPGRQQIPTLPPARAGSIHVGVDEIGTMGEPSDASSSFPKIARGSILVIRGWAFDLERKMPCKRVFVTVGDECSRAIYGIARDDVLRDQNVPEARFTGFTARLGTASLAPGKHRLGLIGVAGDESAVGESTYPLEIEIEEPVRNR